MWVPVGWSINFVQLSTFNLTKSNFIRGRKEET